jgi:SAM-dependent methyltransferase
MNAGSYASKTSGLTSVVREAAYQVQSHLVAVRHVRERARHFIGDMRANDVIVERMFGRPLEGLDVLDVGTGTLASQALYFACRNNRVTSIDLEPQSIGWSPLAYLKIARDNGARRALKTLARKIIGLDRYFPAAMAREMGQASVPPMTLLHMDAARMTFPDASFDLVHSYDVLEHVEDVDATLREIARVLRPGGIAYLVLMPYTCENGSHDFRLIAGHRGDLPYWAHLRPQHVGLVQPGAYVNRLGVRDVEAITRERMPGAEVLAPRRADGELPARLAELRAQGELAGYTDDELLAVRQQIFWRKPG